jgi:hypothetical protein
MTKRTRRREPDSTEEEYVSPFPLWVWVLIFILPLAFSEFMFYQVGRTFSMVAFPVAWVGFWWVMMERSDWAIFKQHKRKDEDQ